MLSSLTFFFIILMKFIRIMIQVLLIKNQWYSFYFLNRRETHFQFKIKIWVFLLSVIFIYVVINLFLLNLSKGGNLSSWTLARELHTHILNGLLNADAIAYSKYLTINNHQFSVIHFRFKTFSRFHESRAQLV